MSIVLAIDTAAPRLQLALRRADGSVDFAIDDIAQGHAELMFPRLAELLGRNGLTHRQIDRIAVTTGPGSFTGLRIGLSAARGLGVARGLPVIGIPSLLAISLSATSGQPVAVLLDARRGEAYFQPFAASGLPAGEPALLPMDEARALIPAGTAVMESPFPDIAAVAAFAAAADPAAFPPEACYVRGADAKPQNKARVARLGVA